MVQLKFSAFAFDNNTNYIDMNKTKINNLAGQRGYV